MPLLERYVLRRITYAFLLTLGVLVATMWVTQVLRQLDVVTTKGHAIGLFLLMTVLAIPAIVQNIAPVAFLIAALVVLNQLNSDSEMAVMSSAGASRRVIARPLLTFAFGLMLVLTMLHHIVSPAALGSLRELVVMARADLLSTLVKDGDFRTVENGLTVHIREKAADGSFRGIFVSDTRDAEEGLRYSAEQGLLVDADGRSFLLLRNGELIRESGASGTLSIVAFETYAFDLSQFRSVHVEKYYKPRERLTSELIHPDPEDDTVAWYHSRLLAELHDRITAPVYILAFALIALAFAATPSTNRQDRGFATAAAVMICVLLRGGGFAGVAAVNSDPRWVPLLYLFPIAGIAFGWAAYSSPGRFVVPAIAVRAADSAAEQAQKLAATLSQRLPARVLERLS